MMEVCGYPELLTHRQEHNALTREVMELKRRFLDIDTYLTVDELLSFLVGWLNHHILLQDMDYRQYAEGNADAQEAAMAYGDFDFSAIGGPPVEEYNEAP
jgi:hemerythrin